MRSITNHAANREPKWHRKSAELTTGYDPRWRP
jgi:hydrogenase small subunit